MVSVQTKHTDQSQTVEPLNRPKQFTENTVANFSDISVFDGLSTEKNLYKAKMPSDEILSSFTNKPLVK